jgi:hypothetical protein
MHYAQVLTRATGGRVTLADQRRTMVEKSHLSGDHGVELENSRTQSTIQEAFFTKNAGPETSLRQRTRAKNVCCASG